MIRALEGIALTSNPTRRRVSLGKSVEFIVARPGHGPGGIAFRSEPVPDPSTQPKEDSHREKSPDPEQPCSGVFPTRLFLLQQVTGDKLGKTHRDEHW